MRRFQKTKAICVLFLMSCVLILVACGKKEEAVNEKPKEVEKPAEKEVVRIYIKTGLEEAFEEIVENFEKDNTDIDLEPIFLTKEEILEEVKNDEKSSVVFTTEDIVKELIDSDLINQRDTKFLMMDELVLFTKSEDPIVQRTKDINEETRVAILNPEKYEEGKMSKDIFTDESFEQVKEENFLIGDSAEDVIQDVMNNNAQIGVLYQSDIYNNEAFRTLIRAPRRVVEPFIFQLGLVSKPESSEASRTVYNYLLSEDVQSILSKYGYVV